MRQCSGPAVPDDAAVVENLLKLGGSSRALSRSQFQALVKSARGGRLAGQAGYFRSVFIQIQSVVVQRTYSRGDHWKLDFKTNPHGSVTILMLAINSVLQRL
jgi:hypothetical protein